MFLAVLTMITALTISAVAIYYSVAGLVAIFAAAALPIMVMGGVLEVGKLVTAVWLHRHWERATWWLKTYLSLAVVVLMLITSMGIFGFLSKAHIEQTSASQESVAQVERLTVEIARQNGIIDRAEDQIAKLETSGTGNDANIQSQIDKEQERIDNAYVRIQPAIDEQNKIIADVTALFQQELDRIDTELATLQGYIDAGDIRKAQGMVGTATDGAYGPKTAAAFTAWQDAKRAERNEWLQKIQQAAGSPTVKAARDEIARLRKSAEDQIAQSNTLINRLRNQIGGIENADDIQKSIDEQNERVRTASSEIDRLTDEKIKLESEYRKLEAEVGPIKYIAEFIYGEQADKNMLEEAVRWVIIVIIFVFDPLAVLLLIASQYTFEYRRKDDNGGWLRRYEQLRAQRIVDNPGFTVDDPKEETDENNRREDSKEESQDAEELRDGEPKESVPSETGDDPVVVAEEESLIEDYERMRDGIIQSHADVELDPEADEEIHVENDEQAERKKYLEDLEQDDNVKKLKQQWKEAHPNDNIKTYKKLYIHGKIDKLPWETIPDTKNRFFYKEEIEGRNYVQNEEQGNNSLWKDINKK